ncbi:MAG TPA: hypothetical protein PLF71_00680 [bacterium]|nr:MAG: hypothetical protein BWY14_00379 [Parcubacteria group bacterium ADurb.Bin192]HPN14620.1 hypothetical protein [bacterium]
MNTAILQFVICIAVLVVAYFLLKPWNMHDWPKILANIVSYMLYSGSFTYFLVYLAMNGLITPGSYSELTTFSLILIGGLSLPAIFYLVARRLDVGRNMDAHNKKAEVFLMFLARLVAYLFFMFMALRPLLQLTVGNHTLERAAGVFYKPLLYGLFISAFVALAPWALSMATPDDQQGYIPWPKKLKHQAKKVTHYAFGVMVVLVFLILSIVNYLNFD